MLAAGLSGVCAQDREEAAIRSGPAKGAGLTPVKCYASHGPHAGKEFDAVAELGEAPCGILFIHELTRNTAPVIRGLDQWAVDFGVLGFKSYTVALSGDRTAGEDLIKRVNGSLKLANPIVLSTDGAEGPGNYGLSRKPTLTFVFAKGGEVHRSIALTDTGPNDVPKIREWIEEVAGKMPEGEALKALIAKNLPEGDEEVRELAVEQALELRRLKAQLRRRGQQGMRSNRQMRSSRERPRPQSGGEQSGRAKPKRAEAASEPKKEREGAPPTDEELRGLLRSFIRKTNDEERSKEIFADIEKRANESEDLHNQVVEMFKLMLSIDYGADHAQSLAGEFLENAKKQD